MTKILTLSKDILQLTKFEIIFFEMITIAAGFFIGHPLEHAIEWPQFLLTFFGVSFIGLASGALNQIQERKRDAQMRRTQNRPLPSGRIPVAFAGSLVLCLLVVGFLFLSWVSTSVLLLGVLAVVSYNGFYTLWWKRKMAFAAIPGAIPGSLPILIGFQAAVQDLSDLRGYYLFAILFFWQMPHFWVLALKYSDDYDQGGFPTLPVAKGNSVTRFQITLWCLAYAGIGLLSVFFFPTGIIGLAGSILISAWLLVELSRFLKQPQAKTWLRFFLSINFSLILYLTVISTDLWSIFFHPTS